MHSRRRHNAGGRQNAEGNNDMKNESFNFVGCLAYMIIAMVTISYAQTPQPMAGWPFKTKSNGFAVYMVPAIVAKNDSSNQALFYGDNQKNL
jgi:hypothetical protein